jgi:ankyrin repeat protein
VSLVDDITSENLGERLAREPELANARDEHGVSSLLLSFYHRRPDARVALLAAGAEVGVLEAAALGDVERLKGADLKTRGGDGFTPLHLAAFFGGPAAVRAILEAGADPDADPDNTFGVHPLHSACAVAAHESARALLEAGADPNVHQKGGFTPLHTAAHNNDVALAELLLEHGADRTLTDDTGQTPLDMAGGDEVRAVLSR